MYATLRHLLSYSWEIGHLTVLILGICTTTGLTLPLYRSKGSYYIFYLVFTVVYRSSEGRSVMRVRPPPIAY